MEQQISDYRAEVLTPVGSGHALGLLGKELTPREQAVLRLVSEGMGYAEIAEQLSLNSLTVRVFVSNALMKLGMAPGLAMSLQAPHPVPRHGVPQKSTAAARVEGR